MWVMRGSLLRVRQYSGGRCWLVGQVGNPMPLVFPGIAPSALVVGRTPRSAADAPVGLRALGMMLTQLFQPRDEGVLAQRAPRPGGPPHSLCRIRSFGKNEWHWVVNLRGGCLPPPVGCGRGRLAPLIAPAPVRSGCRC